MSTPSRPKAVTVHWAELDVKARIKLYWDEAPNLCRAIVDSLPLRSISWHSVISGENIGFPLPVVWTKADNPRVRTYGEVYLYANGQLGIIPYGKTTEPGDVNVWGSVEPDDMAGVERAGRTVAEHFRSGPGKPFFVDIDLAD